jgi:hypothetical protein
MTKEGWKEGEGRNVMEGMWRKGRWRKDGEEK